MISRLADITDWGVGTIPAPLTGVKAMYLLTLTADERRAFDWVGYRYNSGKVADLLLDCIPEDREWGDNTDITFTIPEHVAWQINELAEEEDYRGHASPRPWRAS